MSAKCRDGWFRIWVSKPSTVRPSGALAIPALLISVAGCVPGRFSAFVIIPRDPRGRRAATQCVPRYLILRIDSRCADRPPESPGRQLPPAPLALPGRGRRSGHEVCTSRQIGNVSYVPAHCSTVRASGSESHAGMGGGHGSIRTCAHLSITARSEPSGSGLGSVRSLGLYADGRLTKTGGCENGTFGMNVQVLTATSPRPGDDLGWGVPSDELFQFGRTGWGPLV